MSISFKELKKNRLTPTERFVLETIDGAKPTKLLSGNIQWYKDGEWLFQQDFKYGHLSIGYECIWRVLRAEFGLTYDEVSELLSDLLYDYTDNGKLKINI